MDKQAKKAIAHKCVESVLNNSEERRGSRAIESGFQVANDCSQNGICFVGTNAVLVKKMGMFAR